MELHCHPREHNDKDATQEEAILREKTTAEQDISEAPNHGSNEKQDEQRVPSLPGTAANGSDNKQRDISNCGN